jgi:hypothetical protein
LTIFESNFISEESVFFTFIVYFVRNITYEQIIELICRFANNQSIKNIKEMMKLNNRTVVRWLNKFRQLIYDKLEKSDPFGGEGYQIQIDESIFRYLFVLFFRINNFVLLCFSF